MSDLSEENKLLPCPFCGNEIDEEKDMYSPERDWKPTFYDPDSGGDPYNIHCSCGLEFCTGTYDYQEFINAWNRRVGDFMPIYAVDFDGTLCESVWPGIGKPNRKLIEHLIQRRKKGAKLILWTCRVNERVNEAVEWCREQGLEFDAVNDNLPEMIEKFGNNSRKIYAHCYIDDLAVDRKKYGLPFKTERWD